MYLRDLYRLAGVAGAAVVIGLAFHRLTLALLLGCAGYLLWEHINLHRLRKWLAHRRRHDAPDWPGIFEEICIEIDRLRERHKKRKNMIGRYLSRFQTATKALPDATIVLDDDNRVEWANKAAETFLAVRWPTDAVERITNLVRMPEFRRFIERPEPHATLDFISPLSQQTHLNILIAPYGANEWLLVARDVTALQRANRIRSDFVANVSHELRTPLTVFRGYLETLAAHKERLPADWRPAFDQMTAHAERMQAIIEELLLLSRLEQNDALSAPQPVSVAEMLADI